MQIMAGAGCQHPALRWALPRGTSLPGAEPKPSATPERDGVLLRVEGLEDVGKAGAAGDRAVPASLPRGCGSGQPDLVEEVPARCRGVEVGEL